MSQIRVYVYSHDAYEEYMLKSNDGCCTIELMGDFFGVSTNIEIMLKYNDGVWIFNENAQYIIYKEEVPYTEEVLNLGCIYKLITTAREYVYLYATEVRDEVVAYDKYDISNISRISIGSLDTNTIMFQNLNLISRQHASIEKFHNGVILDDLSCNGVFVNNKKINGRTYITFGSKIFIFGLEIIYLGNVLAIKVDSYDEYKLSNAMIKYYEQMPVICNDKESKEEQILYYNRSPRSNLNDDKTVVKIMSKPNIDVSIDTDKYLKSSKDSIMLSGMFMGICAMAIAVYKSKPKIAAGVAVVLVGIAFIYLVVKVIEKSKINKAIKLNEEREKRSRRLYDKYLSDQDKLIAGKVDKYRDYMLDRYKSADEYSSYGHTSAWLWNRVATHDDFLRFRIGLGSVMSNIEVEIPPRSEFKNEVLLYSKLSSLQKKYQVMKEMPICLDLKRERVIGIVSENKKVDGRNIVNALVTSIATNACYTDVKMAFIFDEKEESYDMYKWLPHIWSGDGSRRYIANNEISARELLNEIYKEIVANKGDTHYVLFISKVSYLVKEPFFRLVKELDNYQGFSVIMVSRYCTQLPNVCELILQNDSKFRGILNINTQKRTAINFDVVEEEKIKELVTRLAPIRVPEVLTRSESIDKCTLLDTFDVETVEGLDIEERWNNNNAYEELNIPIGFTKQNEIFNLNVHEKYFGPHGLIAGTTGSGKSELIKSFITALAINYSPEDVNFLIIDYKGGIMAYELDKLPHIVGSINNLSKEIVDRTLLILKGEVDRRQQLLSTYGVNNIDSLIKLNKCGEIPVKVPHLFIVVDEFARLKEMEPEFIKELVSISAVGRSLGINLLLATQKPSGNIDDNIWSNSKYRICLRVTSEQDSYEVLHNEAAASISNVGGAYVQVGNDEIFEEVQTAYLGEIYDERLIEKKSNAMLIEYDGRANDFKPARIIKKKEQLRIMLIEKLIYMLISINKKTNIMYANQLTEENFETVINKLYDKLESQGISYERNSVNSKKLCNFAGLCILIDKGEFKTIHEQACEIIRKADEEGIILPEPEYKTQLEAIIDNIASVASDKYKVNNLMLEELPTKINLNEINEKSLFNLYDSLVGVYDDPYGLKQEGFYINQVNDGHILIHGGILSGKSTLLRTYVGDMITRYTSEQLGVYCIDFNSGMLKEFEGSSAINRVYIEDNKGNEVETILDEIQGIIDERRQDNKGTSIIENWQDNKITDKLIILVIDDIAKLCRHNAGRYEVRITDILKEGMAVGVYVCATASSTGTSGTPSRVANLFKTSICMQLKDKYEYMQCMHFVGDMVLPKKNIPGRGVAIINNKLLEFQTAIWQAKEVNELKDKVVSIKERNNKDNKKSPKKNNKNAKEINIKEIKVIDTNKISKVTWTNHKNNKEVKKLLKDNKLPLGKCIDNKKMYCVNLKDSFVYNVVGDKRTGKTGIMKVIMSLAAINKNDKVYIVDFTNNLYAKVAARLKAQYVTTIEQFNDMLEDLATEYAARKETPKDDKIYVFGDMERFIKAIYKPMKSGLDATQFMENISVKGSGYNIYFIMEMSLDAERKLGGYAVYNNFMEVSKGISTSECKWNYDRADIVNIPVIRG